MFSATHSFASTLGGASAGGLGSSWQTTHLPSLPLTWAPRVVTNCHLTVWWGETNRGVARLSQLWLWLSVTSTVLLSSGPIADQPSHSFGNCDRPPSLSKTSEACLRLFWLRHLPIDYFFNTQAVSQQMWCGRELGNMPSSCL